MSIITELQASVAVAKRLEEEGYVVSLEPQPADVPFSLDGYRPDILAVKPSENLIVEVKLAGSRKNPEQYMRLAALVAQHPGWSFKLVTLPYHPEEDIKRPAASVQQIRSRVLSLMALNEQPELAEFAIAGMWVAYIAAVHLLVAQQSQKASTLTDLGLLNLAYSQGLLTFDEVAEAQRMRRIRNEAMHSIEAVQISSEDVKSLAKRVEGILERLKNDGVAEAST